MAVGAMMLCMLPSCDKDEDNQSADPDNYKMQNVSAIEKALIAKKVVTNVDKYEMQNYICDDGFRNFVTKVVKFSHNAAVAIGANEDGNTAVSPVSVFMALAMAAESADGETRQEILDVLGVTYEELSKNINLLCYVCNQILSSNKDSGQSNELKCVNSLWVQDGVEVKDEGVQALTNNYNTDLFNMDFIGSDVNKLVTSYISNETQGLLSPNLGISPNTMLILMNVVYLRDVWSDLVEALDYTENTYTFLNYNKSTTSTKLLDGFYSQLRAVETEKFRKAYTRTDGGLVLTFIVPKFGYTLDDIYTSEVLNDTTRYIYYEKKGDINYRYHTRCLFPEFSASFDDCIEEVIKKMGVSKFFTKDCDFSHLTDDPVFCSKIRHVTKLEVTRYGIEGAAVTAELMCGSAEPGPEIWKDVYEDFIVDRDFAYVLSKDNVPLFTGVVKTVSE